VDEALIPHDLYAALRDGNYRWFIGSSNGIGAFESGLAARLLGLLPSVVFGGCMTLLVVATTAWKVPGLRKMDRIG